MITVSIGVFIIVLLLSVIGGTAMQRSERWGEERRARVFEQRKLYRERTEGDENGS